MTSRTVGLFKKYSLTECVDSPLYHTVGKRGSAIIVSEISWDSLVWFGRGMLSNVTTWCFVPRGLCYARCNRDASWKGEGSTDQEVVMSANIIVFFKSVCVL